MLNALHVAFIKMIVTDHENGLDLSGLNVDNRAVEDVLQIRETVLKKASDLASGSKQGIVDRKKIEEETGIPILAVDAVLEASGCFKKSKAVD